MHSKHIECQIYGLGGIGAMAGVGWVVHWLFCQKFDDKKNLVFIFPHRFLANLSYYGRSV
jgi:hypothetical protein